MPIYTARRIEADGWTSFESDSHLSVTRHRMYDRCLPCLEGLLRQLRAGAARIELQEAWDCWKVTAELPNIEYCLQFLQSFEERYPQEYVYGKFGTGNPQKDTRVVVFHADNPGRGQELFSLAWECANMFLPGSRVFVSRGCANPYEQLLGPWPDWEKKAKLKYPERVRVVTGYLQQLLYDYR